ncbi:MAG: hypothetical protein ACR2OB_04955 [Solirubrobacteraceae bacterium]
MFDSRTWSSTGVVVLAIFLIVGLVLLASGRGAAGAVCLALGAAYMPIRAQRSRSRS